MADGKIDRAYVERIVAMQEERKRLQAAAESVAEG